MYEIRHNLICTLFINSFYVFRLNMKDLIRIEMQNIRTVYLLVLKVYIHKLTIHGMSNMTVDTNIFDKQWRLNEEARFPAWWLDVILTSNRCYC